MKPEFSYKKCFKCFAGGQGACLIPNHEWQGGIERMEAIAEVDFSAVHIVRELLICQKCVGKVEEAFKFRESLLPAEAFHARKRKVSPHGLVSFNIYESADAFGECKVCLVHAMTIKTKKVLKETCSSGADVFKLVSKFTYFRVKIDLHVVEGFICSECVTQLNLFCKTRKQLKVLESPHILNLVDSVKTIKVEKVYEVVVPSKSHYKLVSNERRKTIQMKMEESTKKKELKEPELKKSPRSNKSTITNKRETDFRCEICKKCYCSLHSLNQHNKTIHGINERKYPCKYCSHVASQKGNLLTHVEKKHKKNQENLKPRRKSKISSQ